MVLTKMKETAEAYLGKKVNNVWNSVECLIAVAPPRWLV
jgi:molecular chaperone DnaK (HSP70)